MRISERQHVTKMLYHQIPAWQFNLQGAEAAVEVVETRGENELFIHTSQRLRGKKKHQSE